MAQRQRAQHLAQYDRDPPRRVGFAVSDLAEQDVVLQRSGGVVARRIEELDLVVHACRQVAMEDPARFQQPLLHALVENAEAVPGGDQLERQRQELLALFVRERLGAAALEHRENGAEFRQLVRVDEAELLEEFVPGRQVGEHLAHRCRRVPAGFDEVVGQLELIEHRQDIIVAGQCLEIESRPDGGSEQQVFGNAGVAVVMVGIVGLDQLDNVLLGKPLGQRMARFQQPSGHVGTLRGIDAPAQTEGVDILLEIEPRQHLGDPAGQPVRIGDAGGRVIDPIGVQVEFDVAGSTGFHQLAGAAAGLVVVILGRLDRAVAKAEQQVFAESAAEQVGSRADIADPAPDYCHRQLGQIHAADAYPATGWPHQPGEQQSELVLAAAALADNGDVLVERHGKADAVEDAAAVVLGQHQIGDHDIPA